MFDSVTSCSCGFRCVDHSKGLHAKHGCLMRDERGCCKSGTISLFAIFMYISHVFV